MKISNFSKTFKNEVFKLLKILCFFKGAVADVLLKFLHNKINNGDIISCPDSLSYLRLEAFLGGPRPPILPLPRVPQS